MRALEKLAGQFSRALMNARQETVQGEGCKFFLLLRLRVRTTTRRRKSWIASPLSSRKRRWNVRQARRTSLSPERHHRYRERLLCLRCELSTSDARQQALFYLQLSVPALAELWPQSRCPEHCRKKKTQTSSQVSTDRILLISELAALVLLQAQRELTLPCGLIQEQHNGVAHDGARYGQALNLPSAKICIPSIADSSVVAVW